MEEYTCEAFEKGYARETQIPGISEKILICNGKLCERKYIQTVHLDAEPVEMCLVNGNPPKESSRIESESNLVEKVKIIVKELPSQI